MKNNKLTQNILQVGHRIKNLRTVSNLSQKELGQCFGVAQNTIAGWENGKRTLSIEEIDKYVKYFKISSEWLLYGIESSDISNKEGNIQLLSISPIYLYYHEDKFLEILRQFRSANLRIFIESEPSTFYRLGYLYLEDIRSGDWYPFETSLAFEGSGGGWNNTISLIVSYRKMLDESRDFQLILYAAGPGDIQRILRREIHFTSLKRNSIPAILSSDPQIITFTSRFQKNLHHYLNAPRNELGGFNPPKEG